MPGARLHPGHDRRLSDDELWDHLASLDVLVLPYLFGTHSGFLEACHDLGTAVVAPRVGHLAEQHPLHSYDVGDASSLAAALRRAYAQGPVQSADPSERAAQRVVLADAHAALYARVVRAVVAA
jgi:hypothetical protein